MAVKVNQATVPKGCSKHIAELRNICYYHYYGAKNLLPEEVEDCFSYFVTIVELENRSYRLVWLLEENAIYIGVINAFRDKRGGA